MIYSYDELGTQYSVARKSDARIHRQIQQALGSSRTVLNVGAGTGSYEQCDRYVVAVEPSATMRAQRPAGRPAIAAVAAALPFDDKSFDASMTILSVHHWPDKEAGLVEMKRVSRERIVIMSYDPDELERFWLFRYLPELADIERQRFPSYERIRNTLNLDIETTEVVVPLDCEDAFNEAFYGRPEHFLNPTIRACQSAWSLLGSHIEQRFVTQLQADLASGKWDQDLGHLRTQAEFRGAIRLWVGKV